MVSTNCSERDGRETSRSTSPTPTTRVRPGRRALRGTDTASRPCATPTSRRFTSGGASASRGARSSWSPRERVGDPSAATALLDVEPWDTSSYASGLARAPSRSALPRRPPTLLSRERSSRRASLALSVPLAGARPVLPGAGPGGGAFDLALAEARLAREAGLIRPFLHAGQIRVVWRPAPSDGGALRVPRHAVPPSRRDVRRWADRDLRVEHGREDGRPEDPRLPPARGAGGALRPGRTIRHARLPPLPLRRRRTGAARRGGASPALVSRSGSSTRRTPTSAARLSPSSTIRPNNQLRRGRALLRRSSKSSPAGLASSPSSPLTSSVAAAARRPHPPHGWPRPDTPRSRGAGRRERLGPPRPASAHIDRQMRFCLEPDVPGERCSDAIAVAELLGLSPALTRRAEDFHQARGLTRGGPMEKRLHLPPGTDRPRPRARRGSWRRCWTSWTPTPR